MQQKHKFLPERLIGLRNRFGLTQSELAEEIGVHLRSVQNWEGGETQPKGKTLRNLCVILKVPPEQFFNDPIPSLKEEPAVYKVNKPNASKPFPLHGKKGIPVISWARAGEGANFSDLEHMIDERIPIECPSDPNAYATIIEGDSMYPNYLPGDRAIFMPNVEAQNGDVVIARIERSGDVYFKLYHCNDGHTVRLTSYNPAYPPMEFQRREFRFIQPLFGIWRQRRK